MLQHASNASHLAVQPEPAPRSIRRRSRSNRKVQALAARDKHEGRAVEARRSRQRRTRNERVREFLKKSVVLMNQAMDLMCETPHGEPYDPKDQMDDILRARGCLVRALAPAELVDEEFRQALAFLIDNNLPEGRAIREHVVELAWQANLKENYPGEFIRSSDGKLMIEVFSDRAEVR
jgi:hypothetical protein